MEEARDHLARASRQLAEADERAPEVTAVSFKLAQQREENHFGERIALAMGRKP